MMNLEKALEIIDQALASVQSNRAGHAALVKAMQVVREALEKK